MTSNGSSQSYRLLASLSGLDQPHWGSIVRLASCTCLAVTGLVGLGALSGVGLPPSSSLTQAQPMVLKSSKCFASLRVCHVCYRTVGQSKWQGLAWSQVRKDKQGHERREGIYVQPSHHLRAAGLILRGWGL